MHRASPMHFLLTLLPQLVRGDLGFALTLEECIRNHALKLAATFPLWGNKCGPVTDKVDIQAMIYEETLTPIFEKHGYTAALRCSM